MQNLLTVDVEDWFQVESQAETIKFSDWHKFKMRVLPNVMNLMALFEHYDVKATFFVLGWIAEKLPDLVGHIAGRGHEIASHGYAHRLAYTQTPAEFAEDIEQSLAAIRQTVDTDIIGYRAPSFSLSEKTPWAWEILARSGFTYDSSIFPVHHDTYGCPHLPRYPFRLELADGQIINEIPMTTWRILGYNFPAAGGGYLRLFPYWYTKRAIRAANRCGHPAIVYVHPWEIDPDQPRTRLSFLRRFRHYANLRTTADKLQRLLAEFRFGTIADFLASQEAGQRPLLSIDEIQAEDTLPPSMTVQPPPLKRDASQKNRS